MLKKYANIYEINTRVWLRELSQRYKKTINLSNIPPAEIKKIKDYGFDAVWLMGIWEPSVTARNIALWNKYLINECRVSLPDLRPTDIISSPYSIKEYKVSHLLGTKSDLSSLRKTLNRLGMKLILDFVPNHMAIDNTWVHANPGFFIQGSTDDFANDPETFFAIPGFEDHIFAHGKDPYFPAWCDTIQLNYFNILLRKAMTDTLLEIAEFSDGVRCDMAMLILNNIHKFVWKERVYANGKFKDPKEEFWLKAISEVKKNYPDFVFIAECYWEKERELFELGFDYAYDKPLYDALQYQDIESIKSHLGKHKFLQEKLIRFIENHDEPRALFAFGREKSKAAITLISFMPGAHLFHEGQLVGFKIKSPVQLARRKAEPEDAEITLFYKKLFSIINGQLKDISSFSILLSESAWGEDQSYKNFVAVLLKSDSKFYILAVNYSDKRSQCYIPLDLTIINSSQKVVLKNLFDETELERDAKELATRGLYLDEEPFKVNLLEITT